MAFIMKKPVTIAVTLCAVAFLLIYRVLNPEVWVTLDNRSSQTLNNVSLIAGGEIYVLGNIPEYEIRRVQIKSRGESTVLVNSLGNRTYDANMYIASGKQQRAVVAYDGKTFKKVYEVNRLIF